MIRILLVDDHAVVREGYKALLEQCGDMQIIGEASDGAGAYRQAAELQPDVIVLDLAMPGIGGLETIGRILKRQARARILVFTMHAHPSFAKQACQAGALGYVTKASAPEDLIRAVREVQRGQRFLSADIAQVLAWDRLGNEFGPLDSLSPREFEVLRLLVDGKSASDIATTLNLSHKTVMNMHYIVKRKLGVTSDIELMRLAVRMNIVDLLELTGANCP